MSTYSQTFYLIIKPAKFSGLAARIVKTINTGMDKDERAIKLTVSVPKTLFTIPQLQADITIPADNISPQVVTAEVLDNVKEILKQQTGFDVSVNLVTPKEDAD